MKIFSMTLAALALNAGAAHATSQRIYSCNQVQQTLSWSLVELDQTTASLSRAMINSGEQEVLSDVLDLLDASQEKTSKAFDSKPNPNQAQEIKRLLEATTRDSAASISQSGFTHLLPVIAVMLKFNPSLPELSESVLKATQSRIKAAEQLHQHAMWAAKKCTK